MVHWIVYFYIVLQFSAEDEAEPQTRGANAPPLSYTLTSDELIVCTLHLNKLKVKPNMSEVIPS